MVSVYSVRLIVEEPLHIGGERLGNVLYTIKVPVVAKMGDGKLRINFQTPIVPKTSIKGVLRTFVERLAQAYYSGLNEKKGALSVCGYLALYHHQPTLKELNERRKRHLLAISPTHMPPKIKVEEYVGKGEEMAISRIKLKLPSVNGEVKKAFKDYVKRHQDRILRIHSLGLLEEAQDRIYEEFASRHCPISILFGTPLAGGSLKFTDLLPAEISEAGYTFTTRSHVAIERRRGVRSTNMLYTVEHVEAGTEYTGYIINVLPSPTTGPMEECITEADNILDMTLQYIEKTDSFIALGSHKSRGYGLARLKLTKIG